MTPDKEHLYVQTDRTQRYYEDHPHPRAEADQHIFRATKAFWHHQGARCVVAHKCEGALEIHHKYIEWADAEVADFSAEPWDEIVDDPHLGQRVIHHPTGRMREAFPEFDWAGFDANGGDPAFFVDSVFNTIPLCSKHHRSPNHGIHRMSGPEWNIQQYLRPDSAFVFSPDEVKE